MSNRHRQVTIRVPPELRERLDQLSAAMPALQKSLLLRLLISSSLRGSQDDQIKRVQDELVAPQTTAKPPTRRFQSPTNSSKSS